MNSRDEKISSTLGRLAKSLTAGDNHAVAELWEAPALVVGDDGVHAVNSMQEVEAFFAGAKDQYNQRGIVDTRADIEKLDWPSERVAVAHVRWPYIDASGKEVGAERSTYTLRLDDAGSPRVRVVVMQGVEQQAK